MSASFVEQAKQYASYHTQPITRYTHYVGIPLIVFSSLIFLGFFRFVITGVFNIDFGWIFTLVLLAYYFRLEWRLALTITPILILFNYLAGLLSNQGPSSTSVWTFVILFLIGWACQLGGHLVEKKRPALMDNLSQAWIAPLFLIAELYFYFGKFYQLQSEIYEDNVKQSADHDTD